MTRWYRGWRNTRSILTTRVFCIASDTTTPSRLFRSPTGCALLLAEHSVGPRQIFFGLAQPRGVLGHPHRELEPEIEDLLGQLPRLLLELVLGELTPLRRFHRPVSGLESPRARHERRRDTDHRGRRPERDTAEGRGHADHAVQDPSGLHRGDPLLRVSVA